MVDSQLCKSNNSKVVSVNEIPFYTHLPTIRYTQKHNDISFS